MTGNSDVDLGPGEYLLSITLHISCWSVLTRHVFIHKSRIKLNLRNQNWGFVFFLLFLPSLPPPQPAVSITTSWKCLHRFSSCKKSSCSQAFCSFCGFPALMVWVFLLAPLHVLFAICSRDCPYIPCEVECILRKSQQYLSSVSKNCSYCVIVLSK